MNTYPAWPARAARAVGRGMAALAHSWYGRKRPGRRWFLFGGLIFWLVIFYIWAAWQVVKLAVFLVIEVVLGVLAVVLLVAGLPWWLADTLIALSLRHLPAGHGRA